MVSSLSGRSFPLAGVRGLTTENDNLTTAQLRGGAKKALAKKGRVFWAKKSLALEARLELSGGDRT